MATLDQFQAQLTRIQNAIDQLKQLQGNLNASQEDQALSTLTSQADQLEALVAPATPAQP